MKFIGIILSILFAETLGQTRYPCRSDNFNLTLHNHASSCNKYVLCVAGEAVVRDCAPGFKFDLRRQICLPGDMANCDIENRECPPYDDPNNLIFINEFECDQYSFCNGGSKIQRRCGSGFHWNPEKNWCDFPENVGCLNHVECPEQGFALLPHLGDCTKFFMCIDGRFTLNSCPPDLIFDIVIEQCNVPDQSTCVIDQKRDPYYGISAGFVAEP